MISSFRQRPLRKPRNLQQRQSSLVCGLRGTPFPRWPAAALFEGPLWSPFPGRGPRVSILLDAMGGHVHAIKKLTDVLVLAEAGLADEGCGPRSEVDVHAREDKLVLRLGALLDDHAGQHVHSAHDLLTQEVAQLDRLAAIGDVGVDGEMRVDETHLVDKLLLNTIEEVADVAADTAELGKMLGLRKVHLRADLLAAVDHLKLHGCVPEVALQGAMLAGDLHNLGLDADLEALGHLDRLRLLEGLHRCGGEATADAGLA